MTKEFLKPFLFSTIAVILIISPFIEPMIYHNLFGEYVVFQKGEMYKRITTTALMPWMYFNPFPILETNDTKYHLLVIATIFLFITIFTSKKIKFPKYSKGIILFGMIAWILSSAIFPWRIMPSFFKMIQFPWRLVTFFSFSLSLILPLCIDLLKKYRKIVFILIISIITFSAYRTISFSSDEYVDFNDIWWNGGMGWQREYLPIHTKNNLEYYYQRGEDILVQNRSDATISILKNEIPNLTFEVTKINQKTVIEFPRIFYYGYNLRKDNHFIDLRENSKGFLEAEIEEEGIYSLRYEGTKTRKIAMFLSPLTGFTLLLLFIKEKIFKKN